MFKGRVGYTYFIQGEQTKLIKIGKTIGRVDLRLKELQAYSPDKLTILGTLDRDIEKKLHMRFALYRVHGEWFTPHPSILTFIENFCNK